MSGGTGALIAVVAVALIFDVLNGFHDGCNAVSTVIYTKALKPQVAIGLSALFNFIGPLAIGVAVAERIGGIANHEIVTTQLMLAALLGACVWEILTWIWALPMSSSHTLIGGLLGALLVGVGPSGVVWGKLMWVLIALFAAPILGIFTGLFFMRLSRLVFSRLKLDMARADKFYKRMQILSSCWVSFSHGSNDATKVMGIIAVFLAARAGTSIEDYGVPVWVIVSCAAAMAVGTYLSVASFRLIRTLGEKITKLHPINGFSAECGGAIVITMASHFGLPVSTTHVVTSAVTGTGLIGGLGAVSWKVFRAIMLTWVVTLPVCAGLAAAFYYLLGIWM